MKSTSDRVLTAIFCDDIRKEVGNKLTFVGCYDSELRVRESPAAIPKLCVFVTLLTPVARRVKWITFRVVQGESKEIARMEIGEDQLQANSPPSEPTATRQAISTALAFSPFLIEGETSICVFAETEEGEITGPRLRIKVGPLGPDDVSLF